MVSFDPFSPEILADPYEHYRRLRDEAPCYFAEKQGWYVLSRYDDIVAALKNTRVFSSTGGVGPNWKSEPIMSMYDPPEHTRLRRLVAPFFTVAAMEELGMRAERYVEQRLGPALAAGRLELVEDFAIPVSLDIMADVLGIVPDQPGQLRRWADATTDQLAGGLTAQREAEADAEVGEFVTHLRGMLRDGRVNPEAPGVVGHLMSAGQDYDVLKPREQLAFCVLLLAAGWGTTAIAIANTIRALAEFPEQWKRLQERPQLLSNVSEEAIRYDGPIQSFFRNTLSDVEVAGTRIPKGSKVQILFASANRDERKFPSPDVFDITRDTAAHIGYGSGIHTCLGAPLARVVIGGVVRAFMRNVASFQLAGPVERKPDIIFRTLAKVPIALERREVPRGASVPPPTARRGRVTGRTTEADETQNVATATSPLGGQTHGTESGKMKIRSFVMNAHGGPEVLEPAEIEIRDAPRPGHVRVRVGAVGLNHLDLWFRRGMSHLKLQFPHRLGSDVAGTIEAVGEGTPAPQPGTPVVLAPGVSCGVCEACQFGDDNKCRDFKILGEFLPGGYGEVVDVPAVNVFPIPKGLTVQQAASIPLVWLTAWALVVERANVKLGESVLIHAAGGGVSSAAIQIAKALGARVIATTTAEAKLAPARALGADEVVDTTKQDFLAEVRKFTNKRGVDVVVDHVGGELFSKSIGALATSGRIATCGATAGSAPSFDLTRTYMRYNSVLGTRMGARRFLFPILREFERGTFKPVIHKTYPMTTEGLREAHRVLEGREAFGKIVLDWSQA